MKIFNNIQFEITFHSGIQLLMFLKINFRRALDDCKGNEHKYTILEVLYVSRVH